MNVVAKLVSTLGTSREGASAASAAHDSSRKTGAGSSGDRGRESQSRALELTGEREAGARNAERRRRRARDSLRRAVASCKGLVLVRST
eukprot:scaffold17023_cov32-Tisochrysis_lutea.AAC.3